MKKYFKEGMTVWDNRGVKGVCEHESDCIHYPICVRFEDGTKETYTYDGRLRIWDDYISLFQTKPIHPTNVPLTE
jgi:hypothetical protein